jgi:mercuric ion transport protein
MREMAMAPGETFPIRRPAAAKAPTSMLAALGATAGLGALFASSCCALPLLLGAVGAGAGTFAALETLAPLRVPLVALAGLAVGFGWFLWWRKRGASCGLRSRSGGLGNGKATAVLLGAATLLVGLAASWDLLEPLVLRLMRAA